MSNENVTTPRRAAKMCAKVIGSAFELRDLMAEQDIPDIGAPVTDSLWQALCRLCNAVDGAVDGQLPGKAGAP